MLIRGRKPSFLDDSVIVHELINGACNKQVAKKAILKVEPWSLAVVFNYINSSEFEPLSACSLVNLTLKTVFLMALATVERISGIHALSGLEEDVQFEGLKGVALKFLPEFRAKNQKADKVFQPIFVPSIFDLVDADEDEMLSCPVRALRMYRQRTQSIRHSRRRLFLSVKENFESDISKNAIARWLVELVKRSYKHAGVKIPDSIGAHDTRRLGSSEAYTRGMSITSLLESARWSSNSVFTDHYLRGVAINPVGNSFKFKTMVLAGAALRV
jgi:hypothetical protein